MQCPQCQVEMKKFGKNRNGSQRYRCNTCNLTVTDESTRPHDNRCLPVDTLVQCLRMLLEGNSIRSTERLTGVEKKTIIRAVVSIGQACERWMEKILKNLQVNDVQADEIWGFVGCKEKTKKRNNYGDGVGDAWCFLATERETKMVIAYHIGRRNGFNAGQFSEKLARATSGRFQLSTDGYTPYRMTIRAELGHRVDYGMMVKVYGSAQSEGENRYSPVEVIDAYKLVLIGNPDEARICTSHAERNNLSIRMGMRRMTRLTNAHSKKLANHEAAFALWFAYYNFCRVHETLTDNTRTGGQPRRKTTPAMAAGLTDHVWSVAELLQHINAD